MSATVIHPREFPKGISGKTIGMMVVGVAVAIGIGYTIANPPVTETAAEASTLTVEFQSAAERQSLLAEATKGINLTPTRVDPADFAIHQRAAEFAAERQQLLAEATKGVEFSGSGVVSGSYQLPRVDEINLYEVGGFYQLPPVDEIQRHAAEVAGAGVLGGKTDLTSGQNAWQSRAEFLEEQHLVRGRVALEKQAMAWESKAEFLENQYRAQNRRPSGLVMELSAE